MNDTSNVEAALRELRKCFDRGGKLLVCGNGGSAADCGHIVGELMKSMELPRPAPGHEYLQRALPAIDLTAQTPLVTAISNDIGGEWIFAQQVYGYGHPDDVLLGISTSGRSPNVLRAFEAASKRGMGCIGLCGPYTVEFDPLCDVVISCPGSNAAEVQEQHIKVYHELCRRLEEEFFG